MQLIRFILHMSIGLLFGLGLLISGMSNPAKVLNFFDIFGNWDPSLLLVLASALAVTTGGYYVIFRQSKPVLAPSFHLPQKRDIDPPLVIGAALFGVGWGISGVCPGASVTALGLGRSEPFVFFGALIAGILLARTFKGSMSGKRFGLRPS